MSISLFPFSLRKKFIPANKHPHTHAGELTALFFIFCNTELLISKTLTGYTIPAGPLNQIDTLPAEYIRYIGLYDATPCYLIVVSEQFALKHDSQWKNLRSLHDLIDHDHYLLAGKASELASWHQRNTYCGKCGTAMTDHATECARICPSCDFQAFPQISPVVIMTVEQGDNILLGRSPHFPKGMYSPLAGFVDPGETAEEAVMREVKEEAGITVKNLCYITSQAWPYPHSLMLGFRSDYDYGEIVIEQDELEDVQWFNVHKLPVLPSSISISRYLLECFIRERK